MSNEIYIPVSVELRLPPHSWRGFAITVKDDGVTMEKKAAFFEDSGWQIDDAWDFQNERVTHWLKRTVVDLYHKDLSLSFYNWANNQVIAGRTTEKLWMDYESEQETPLDFINKVKYPEHYDRH